MSPDQTGNSDSSRLKEKGTLPVTLKEALEYATFSENRALALGVRSLQLGELGKIGDNLLDLTLKHPQSVEYGIRAFVSGMNGLFFPEAIIEGVISNKPNWGGEIAFPPLKIYTYPERRNGPKEYWQDRFIAASIHTHANLDFPPSPDDYVRLFLANDNPAAETAVFVVTKSRKPDRSFTANKYIIFRGTRTPQWSEEQITTKVKQWEKMIVERISRHINLSMSRDQQKAINARVQAAFMRDLIKAYDLRLFTAVNGSENAVEATA